MRDHHLILPSILAGITPAYVYVDDVSKPTSALVHFHNKLFFLGSSRNTAFNENLNLLLTRQIFPAARQKGDEVFVAFSSHPTWVERYSQMFGSAVARIIPDAQRQYYAFDAGQNTLYSGWQELLPLGYTLRPVDAALLAGEHWNQIDYLREETQSERSSVEDFLAHSFGVCLTHRDELVAWCLSEYNYDSCCEVGIATVEAHQRQGLGTLIGCAFVDEALRRGYEHIGWHCWARNIPSSALAKKIGYTLRGEENVAVCIFPEAEG